MLPGRAETAMPDSIRSDIPSVSSIALGAGSGEEFHVQGGGGISPALLQQLNRQQDWKSALSVLITVAMIAGAVAAALIWWPWAIAPALLVIVSRQHSLAILAHDATHYRLFS